MTNFSLRVGRPKVDICAICELLKNKMKSNALSAMAKRTAEAELVVFNRGTKKFYSALKKSTETYETSEDVF
jgi:hypothetical protein